MSKLAFDNAKAITPADLLEFEGRMVYAMGNLILNQYELAQLFDQLLEIHMHFVHISFFLKSAIIVRKQAVRIRTV